MIARLRRWWRRAEPVTTMHVARLEAADTMVADEVDSQAQRLASTEDQLQRLQRLVDALQANQAQQGKLIATLQQQRLKDIYGRNS